MAEVQQTRTQGDDEGSGSGSVPPLPVALSIGTMPDSTRDSEFLGDRYFSPCFAAMQVLMLVLYGAFATYDETCSADTNNTEAGEESFAHIYGTYQDVHVMIFVGIGFLFTYLRKYGFGSVSFNFVLGAFVIQWSVLVHGFFSKVFENGGDSFESKIAMNLEQLVVGDFAAATLLISFGGLLGVCSPTQFLLMAILETVFYAVNFEVCITKLKAVDIGGTIVIHIFAAYFGLAVSWMVAPAKARGHEANSSRYSSDIFSMIGTIFLWVYWPSFIGVLATGNARVRILLHTVFAMSSSCSAAFITSSLARHKRRFDMADLQNATLAGGVMIGAVANFTIGIWGAMLLGSIGGIVSVLGFAFLQPFLEQKIGLFDAAGINNLHGVPGLLGGIASAVGVYATADYGDNIGVVFPELVNGRSKAEQFGVQFAAVGVTLAFAICGGLLTGKLMTLIPNSPELLFSDRQYFNMPDDFYKLHGEKANSAGNATGEKATRKAKFKRKMSVSMRGVQFSTTESPKNKWHKSTE